MKINKVFELLNIDPQPFTKLGLEKDITGITDDSRQVSPGQVFTAVEGHEADGHDYILEACRNGAALIVGSKKPENIPVPFLYVEHPRRALGILAAAFYQYPARDKRIIGVTGTNGKTTITHLLHHLLESSGFSCGRFGTVGNYMNGKSVEGFQTTPGVVDLHKWLYESRDDVIVMEVSSHGLDQHRLEGVSFDITIFTNLQQDHLDYHPSMEEYFKAKSKLFFMMKERGQAIIHVDDPWGDRLSNLLRDEGLAVTSIGGNDACDIQIDEVSDEGIRFLEGGKPSYYPTPIAGVYNSYNTLQACTAAAYLGVSKGNMVDALESFPGIPGRFEQYSMPNGAHVIIDYAHTADSIRHILQTAARQFDGNITHVFGFRGNRDESKRPSMLQASAEWSDGYILTLDDLNAVSHEDMTAALSKLHEEEGRAHGRIIPDRTSAIKTAVEAGREGDVIVITGKGHETYKQSYQRPFSSDRETVVNLRNEMKTDVHQYQ
ncbi:UDP-N-acetylmuramoyl-L-alanyl-D-glutamate--2,6-diaminopimelate ligase [Halobacillus sp. Cin3]|uniref:UDP-N-acetylmuramoyl-L-alanyl-D-glutamate--2, 6-diaminopimelate ligase n=1 Tax=Halobacillus sp. Cin3 TaxID=2928441 RepID=UPI00248E72D0|nr:UDP-N-acetylmuramoyl-L-alanyl-D-glutamate--2,6-diaminopimelate ligase [Halobacillus sp. Cin3]